MIDWNKIRKHEESIKIYKAKIAIEKDYKQKERLRLKVQIEQMKIKLEKLN
jgi:hypothetical protein